MKKQITPWIACIAITGFALAARGGGSPDQLEFPQIAAQPTDQAVPLGGTALLAVQATNATSFQWLRNGVAIAGQTNSTLSLENVGLNDVGYYSCYVVNGSELVPTRSASLNVFTTSGWGTITVFGFPVFSGGTSGSCPGTYAGYVNYTKTVSQGWGWAPSSGVTVHTATDTNRTDTKVYYTGKYGDTGCAQTSVTVPHPTTSPKYRFTVYFPDNVPTNSYGLSLDGFDP